MLWDNLGLRSGWVTQGWDMLQRGARTRQEKEMEPQLLWTPGFSQSIVRSRRCCTTGTDVPTQLRLWPQKVRRAPTCCAEPPSNPAWV